MQLYFIPSENRYVRTQGEARRLGFGEVTEIPVDKDGLMGFLNELHRRHNETVTAFKRTVDSLNKDGPDTHVVEDALRRAREGSDDKPCPECPECPEASVAPVKTDFSAEAVLSRMDNPGGKVDEAVELIARSKGYALKRFAGAVAVAFQNI